MPIPTIAMHHPGKLDIQEGDPPEGLAAAHGSGALGSPAIGVYFRCANVYQRVHRSADGTHYLARCAGCGKSMRFVVGPGGDQRRQFQVTCAP
jgi:hypothetical protein